MGLSLLQTLALLIFQALIFASCAKSGPKNNSNLFREYLGAEFKQVTFSDVPINSGVEFHYILSFAIDYMTASSSPSPANCKFNVFWDTDNLSPGAVAAIKAKHPIVKIIQEYNLDGTNVDYEHFKTEPDTFARCVGQLITALKRNGVVSFASIAPFDDEEVQRHYMALWKGYGDLIDYVNFQFYAYDEGTTVAQFLRYFDEQSGNYGGGKVLPSFISGGLGPDGGFFTACSKL
ncbi:hypothetical protein SASPL_104469 [Salvia splendens]|uniref:GH18 domain-containing protein n=1 Tax=Salvia splendens TaxID=180675 RepID=A0A8X8YJZ3_SALSN|nr:hypothetical protein SASPL_104469 [Salvia splendens]